MLTCSDRNGRSKGGTSMKPNKRLAPMTLLMVVATSAAALAPAGRAFADPPANGCPAGYQLLSVSALSAQGYKVPALVDSPTSGIRSFGQPGNGDGWVCGVQLGNRLTPFGGPLYNFTDNTLPAS
jgi:hypothetical protein